MELKCLPRNGAKNPLLKRILLRCAYLGQGKAVLIILKDFMKRITGWIAAISRREALEFVAVALVIFAAAKFGQYLFFDWKTSPAIIWPPTGIAAAIIWIRGYRYALPVFLGLFAASLTGPAAHLIPGVITTPMAQVLGHVTVVYLLRRLKFDGTFATMRSVTSFLLVIVVACMVAPTITTLISALTGNLTTAAYYSWSRAWAGYIFSCLILFPLLVAWAHPKDHRMRRGWVELGVVSLLVLASVYFLFWTRIAADFSFLFFALFFVTHFWVGLRFSMRTLTLSIFVTTVIGILGLFLSPAPGKLLNSQLFASELFLFLVVPIFYVFSALVKERARTVDDLREAMERIEKESIIKNEFIAVLAHELRNPLAPVKTTLEILELQEDDFATRQLIVNAHQQVHSMRRLLDDLLDITRVTQGKFQLQIERSHLCTMIAHSIQTTETLFKDRGHEIVVTPSCDDSIWLYVDPVRFEQVLVNILNNAAKYTNPGGRIEIAHRTVGGMLEVSVSDNGLGIDPEHLEDVFAPFWQVRNAVSRTSGGIGVGLSLTKHIVEMHGGTIHAESAGKGKGSTFTICMPLPQEDKVIPRSQVRDRGSIGSFRILVVDDNEAAADSLAKLLTLKGHVAETAYSGNGMFEAIQNGDHELVLLDIGLPDMSGYDAALRLRAEGFSGKLVALTGYGQKEDKQKAVDAGFDHHITKPMSIVRLEEYLITLDGK